MFGHKKEAPKEENNVVQMPQPEKHPVQDPTTGAVIGMAGSSAEEVELIRQNSEAQREAA